MGSVVERGRGGVSSRGGRVSVGRERGVVSGRERKEEGSVVEEGRGGVR